MIIIAMVIILLSSTIFIFDYSYRYQHIDNIVALAPREYANLSIYNKDDELYFDSGRIESLYLPYLSKIGNYSNSYNINFHYYDVYGGGIVDTDITGVEIIINAKLVFDNTYSRIYYLELKDKELIQHE